MNSEIEVFLVALFALIVGSFTSLFSYRVETNQPIVFARSACPNCHSKLTVLNLIPIISWLAQLGKCTKCGNKISVRYPLIEAFFLIIFLVIFYALGQEINAKTILYFLIAATLMAMSVIDIERYFIPNSTQYFLAILATLLNLYNSNLALNPIVLHLEAAFLYAAFGLALLYFFYLTSGVEAIGVDDVKFLFLAGFLLGISKFLLFIAVVGAVGVVFGLCWKAIKHDETFPFAPSLCASTLVCLLFGEKFGIDVIANLFSNLFSRF